MNFRCMDFENLIDHESKMQAKSRVQFVMYAIPALEVVRAQDADTRTFSPWKTKYYRGANIANIKARQSPQIWHERVDDELL